jgi:NADPH:quinone reductase-like Zn-dependent oxidoreductase
MMHVYDREFAAIVAAMRIDVLSAATTPVATHLFSGWGSMSHGAASVPGEALLCACSGVSETGEDVIALLKEPARAGATVEACESMCFARSAKRRSWTHAAAAQLPLLALTAAAALNTVGLPTGKGQIGFETKVSANVLVAGSSGRLPDLLVQILAARGARACVAAQRDASDRLCALGAAEVIDHDELSFSTAFGARKSQPLDAVLDVVGSESASDSIHKTLGAAYVSLASPALRRLETEGALAALRMRWRQLGETQADGLNGASIWTPDATACDALREVLQLIEEGKVAPPPEANAALETMEQYSEFLNWSRDSETGLRCGFPGVSMWPAEEEESDDGGGLISRGRGGQPQRMWTMLGNASNLEYIQMPPDFGRDDAP